MITFDGRFILLPTVLDEDEHLEYLLLDYAGLLIYMAHRGSCFAHSLTSVFFQTHP